ncbi:MAG: 5-histidylcysteine sulfoxide synthase [Thiobacillaceae bacterium]|nr:5-histidylcysteine sulfoxide synthase [Thiobacillaceae bacterium]
MDTLRDFHTRNLLLDQGPPEVWRARLRDYFDRTTALYERLFDCLRDDAAFYVQPEPLRHPHIFYYGHTATFYVNKLNLAGLTDERIHPEFESMFAVGVDEMSWDDLNPAHYRWPPVAEVRAYRTRMKALVHAVIERLPIELPVGWDSPAWALLMGIEHERIHLETSSVLIRQTALEHLKPPADPVHAFWVRCPQMRTEPGSVPRNELLPVPGGRVEAGKPRGHKLYGWDNEYGRHTVEIAPFRASRYLVSNAEYLAFVEAGGYRQPRWWTEEGRAWLAYRKPEHPLFWRRAGGHWRYRTLAAEIDMPWDWPVDVNWLEAKAFCNWKAAQTGRPLRLPTEDEWLRLRDHSGIPDEPDWGPAGSAPGNINLEHWASACPVDRFVFRDGFCDVVGNVWQWTETPIDAFEGFAVHPLYDDFSTPTFDDKHNLIKGGSFISTGNEASRHARYAFRRHFFQHAGLRYVEAGENPYGARVERSTRNLYETDAQVAQYCEFHYGPEYFGVANFPAACAALCLQYMQDRPRRRALDLGCAVGRAAYELARGFAQVEGIDYTARFIRVALALKEQGRIAWAIPTEGELTEARELRLADLGLAEVGERVAFWQGDATNLKPQFTGYDLIFAGNLIDRLAHPRAFLQRVHERLQRGGLLILTSPYTWLEEYTPKAEWLGGYRRDGRPVSSLEGLQECLHTHFRLVDRRELPFVLRETARKYQHTVAELTVWERR